MNENKLKELYTNEINAAAPDKDALWERIEGRLTEKTAEPIPVPVKKPHRFSFAGAAAAAIIVLIGAHFAISGLQDSVPVNENFTSSMAENTIPDDAVNEYAPSSVADKPVQNSPLSYEDLSFTSYSETVIKCMGAPYGADYFVEEEVLSETDYIVTATVSSVFESDDGQSVCYELTDIDWYAEEGLSESVVIESRSPYTMRRGRQYLILLTQGENGLHTAFDGVPQIEYTADGGLVYYNGWSALDDSAAQSLIYPQGGIDDFFYDRMRFSYSADIPALISKWLGEKQV